MFLYQMTNEILLSYFSLIAEYLRYRQLLKTRTKHLQHGNDCRKLTTAILVIHFHTARRNKIIHTGRNSVPRRN